MSKVIPCFWLEPIDQAERHLRRFVFNSKCTGPHKYHTAEVFIGKCRIVGGGVTEAQDWPREDPRWPKACPCGYVFTEKDEWQVNIEPLYRRAGTGATHSLRDAPVGALWDAWWMTRKGPDGRSIICRTPGGDWWVDGPSSNGNGWQRTGTPPKLTVTPSILCHGGYRGGNLGECPPYHGFLTDGALVEC